MLASSMLRDMLEQPVEALQRRKMFEKEMLKSLQDMGFDKGVKASFLRLNISLRSIALTRKIKRSS